MTSVTYKKILITHDGSVFSSKALPHAASLVKKYDAQLIVLQVIDAMVRILPAITTTPATIGTQEVMEDLAKQERKSAKNSLSKIKADFENAGITDIKIVIEEGDARDVIIKTAKKNACDLIIMSTHGWSGLKRVFLGSIAEDVVRKAPCPVLLIKVKKDK